LGIYNKSENITNELIEVMTDLQAKGTPGTRTQAEINEVLERYVTNYKYY
jgi:hypothetical protein